jgi:hypothetical protein
VTVHNERGDVNISDMANDVTVSTPRATSKSTTPPAMDVTLQKGDVKATDTKAT